MSATPEIEGYMNSLTDIEGKPLHWSPGVKAFFSREQFPTGSQRDSRQGKGRFDLIPPHFLQLLAKHYEQGGLKYGDKNWLKGQPLSRYLDSALRHINNYQRGLRDEEHLIAAIWNLIALLETERLIEEGKLNKELHDL